MDAIEAVAHVHVTAESVTGQDVSQQFVDLHARLVNLGAQEKVLLRLMDRAETISESIRVENYLQQVEFQIEDVQGRMLYLQNRTSMSTITVALHEAGKKPAPRPARERLLEGRERIAGRRVAVVTSVIVGAGLVVPLSILGLLALLVGRRLAPLAHGFGRGARASRQPPTRADGPSGPGPARPRRSAHSSVRTAVCPVERGRVARGIGHRDRELDVPGDERAASMPWTTTMPRSPQADPEAVWPAESVNVTVTVPDMPGRRAAPPGRSRRPRSPG